MKRITTFSRSLLCLVAAFGFGFEPMARAQSSNPFVHQLFSSHMVLQRDAADPIWGWTTAGNTVTVTVKNQTGSTLQTRTALADSSGRWQTTVGPFGLVANNAAYSMTISAPGQTTVTLSDILIGDVILCSGQSNMTFDLTGALNSAAEIADSANYPNIRCFTAPQVPARFPQQTLQGGSWQVAGPSTTSGFSAVGYFTARELYKKMGIPTGIIVSAWGGTVIDCWIDHATAASMADYTQVLFDEAFMTSNFANGMNVCGLYDGMIAPLAPLRIKAVEWYQGESNTGRGEQYSRLLPGLMNGWRSLFGQPALPFIIIQICADGPAQTDPVETTGWGELREAQSKVVLSDSNSRMVTTIDLGVNTTVHPPDKQDVGLRASWACEDLLYGQNVVSQGPVFTGATVSGSTIRCSFSNVGAGLMAGAKNNQTPLSPVQPVVGGTLTSFAIAGANGVYYWANAVISSGSSVDVSSPNVAAPLYVRHAWAKIPTPACSLYSSITDASGHIINGIPASSFRNDPSFKLSVNGGTGTGFYSFGSQAAVSGSNIVGETFDHWSGDTGFLSGTTGITATATISKSYESEAAIYRVTGAPAGFTAVSQSGQVALSWTPMPMVHYNVKRSTTSTGPYSTIAPNLTGTASFVDRTASYGSSYYYAISAVGLMGEGPNSNALVAGPLAVSAPIKRSGWAVSASNIAGAMVPENAIDGNGNTAWSTGTTQASGQWFQIDMGTSCLFSQIVLDPGTSANNYPASYQVVVSSDGVNWSAPVFTGTGSPGVTTITLAQQTARYIRVALAGGSANPWTISEMNVVGAAPKLGNLDTSGWVANASSSVTGRPVTNALDGNLSTRWSTGASQAYGQWFQIDMGIARTINQINLQSPDWDYLQGYLVNLSNDGINWGSPVAIGAGTPIVTCIAVPELTARYIRITQTGTCSNWWSIYEANVIGPIPEQSILDETGWVVNASSSVSGRSVTNALDGDLSTRWSTGASQVNGQWFQIDMGMVKMICRIDLDTPDDDYPRGYQVTLSNDGVNWGSPVAFGNGRNGVTSITLPELTARYIRITQTGTSSNWWSIYEAHVIGPVPIEGLLDETGWVVNASSSVLGRPVTNVLDGDLSTRWSTGASQVNGQWFQIDMRNARTIYQINLATPDYDYPQGYQVSLSNDGTNWDSPVVAGRGCSGVTSIAIPELTARYIRITQTGSCDNWWSIYEVEVIGK